MNSLKTTSGNVIAIVRFDQSEINYDYERLIVTGSSTDDIYEKIFNEFDLRSKIEEYMANRMSHWIYELYFPIIDKIRDGKNYKESIKEMITNWFEYCDTEFEISDKWTALQETLLKVSNDKGADELNTNFSDEFDNLAIIAFSHQVAIMSSKFIVIDFANSTGMEIEIYNCQKDIKHGDCVEEYANYNAI